VTPLRHEEGHGEWVSVGLLRPFVPRGTEQADVTLRLAEEISNGKHHMCKGGAKDVARRLRQCQQGARADVCTMPAAPPRAGREPAPRGPGADATCPCSSGSASTASSSSGSSSGASSSGGRGKSRLRLRIGDLYFVDWMRYEERHTSLPLPPQTSRGLPWAALATTSVRMSGTGADGQVETSPLDVRLAPWEVRGEETHFAVPRAYLVGFRAGFPSAWREHAEQRGLLLRALKHVVEFERARKPKAPGPEETWRRIMRDEAEPLPHGLG